MERIDVLLVEDDPDFRDFLAMALAGAGLAVGVAETAEDALSSDQALMLLLTDVDLDPGMTGFALAAQDRWPGVPAILMTGHPKPLSGSPHPVLTQPFSFTLPS